MKNININNNSLYNRGGEAIKSKLMKRFSMFDGVGLDLTNANTYDEALEMAGLDYTATKVPLFLEDGTEVKNYFGTAKSDDPGFVLGVVGNQYSCVGNRDAFAVAEEIVEEGYARYEVGGPSLGSKNKVDYAKSFLVLRGDDFDIKDDTFNSFVVFNNSFDGSTGVQYQVICQRVLCLNGMVRFLGGKQSQLKINIQHSKTANEKIQIARNIVMQRQKEIELVKKEAEIFINQGFTRAQFEKEIIPLVLKEKKIIEGEKERERGQERIENMVAQLMTAYNADDVQNYSNSAYRVILALSDWETHASPLRDTGNGQIYLNRITKGMLVTAAVAKYIAETRGLPKVIKQ